MQEEFWHPLARVVCNPDGPEGLEQCGYFPLYVRHPLASKQSCYRHSPSVYFERCADCFCCCVSVLQTSKFGVGQCAFALVCVCLCPHLCAAGDLG